MVNRFRLPVLLLFVGSGLAALIYEIVWFQMLQLVVGSSSVSMGVLLGTFMGGMCAGSFLLARLVPRHVHPLRVYAILEAAIGLCGLALLAVIPAIGSLYTAWAGTGPASFVVRGLVAAVCLLPPTLAMGATLPAMARWVETTPRGMAWLGLFYAGNTAGAVIGSALAGFYLLRLYDVGVTTGVALLTNLLVGWLAWQLARVSAGSGEASGNAPAAMAVDDGRLGAQVPVLLTMALSGFCALSAEVVWTRYLSLLIGATTYSFSIILAVFLAALGIGGAGGSWLAARLSRPRLALAIVQLLSVPAILYAGVMLADVSGEEVENYLLSNDLVKPTDSSADSPTNAGCSDEEHAKMATKTVRFF